MYIQGVHKNNQLIGTDTLKPVIPPFLPPPTFETADTNQTRMPKRVYRTRFNLDDDLDSDHMVRFNLNSRQLAGSVVGSVQFAGWIVGSVG